MLLMSWLIGLMVAALPQPEAQDEAAILKQAVNWPGTNWSFYGETLKSKPFRDGAVPGGEAVRVTVARKGDHPWDAGAISPIQKPVAAGDVLLLAIWARAPELGDEESTPIDGMSIAEVEPPNTAITQAKAAISNQWKMYFASGRAAKDYPPGSMQVAVNLAAAAHVIDLGPVFVLDFGKDHDMSKLPSN